MKPAHGSAMRRKISGLPSAITAEECDLLDAIYLPSKYPLGSALPDFAPDEEICRQCVQIAERVVALARQ